MKTLMRKLARVSDSSQYLLLRPDSSPTRAQQPKPRRQTGRRSASVPEGHLPVYVGDDSEMLERFVVNADLLNHPIFIHLLDKSANEYGYEQPGVLRIPCRVLVFQQLLHLLQHQHHLDDLHHLHTHLFSL